MKIRLIQTLVLTTLLALSSACKDDNMSKKPIIPADGIEGSYKGKLAIKLEAVEGVIPDTDTEIVQKLYIEKSSNTTINLNMKHLRFPDIDGELNTIGDMRISNAEVSAAENSSTINIHSTTAKVTFAEPWGEKDVTVRGYITGDQVVLDIVFPVAEGRMDLSEGGGSSSYIRFTGSKLASDTESGDAEITSFEVKDNPYVLVQGMINDTKIEFGIDPEIPEEELAAIVPTITVSEKATVSPDSGKPADFTEGPVIYTVTSEDGVNVVKYEVTAKVLANTRSLITAIEFADNAKLKEGGNPTISYSTEENTPHTILFTILYGADKEGALELNPSFTLSSGATISFGGSEFTNGTKVDFTNASSELGQSVTFIVTAEDGVETSTYLMSWKYAPNHKAELLGITFDEQLPANENIVSQPVSEDDQTWTFIYKYDTSDSQLDAFVPVFDASDNAVVTTTGKLSEGNYTITVVSEDESETNTYRLEAVRAPNGEALVSTVTLSHPAILRQPVRSESNPLIWYFLTNAGTDLSTLTDVKINDIVLSDGASMDYNKGDDADFSSGSFTINVTSADGLSTNPVVITIETPAYIESIEIEDHVLIAEPLVFDKDRLVNTVIVCQNTQTLSYGFQTNVKAPAGYTVMPASGIYDYTSGEVTFTVKSHLFGDDNQATYTVKAEKGNYLAELHSFENWVTKSYTPFIFNPVSYTDIGPDWSSANEGVAAMIWAGSYGKDDPYGVVQNQTDAITGQYALQAQTLKTAGGTTYPVVTAGSAFLGTFKTNMTNKLKSTSFGINFLNKKPLRVVGNFKYTPGPVYYDGTLQEVVEENDMMALTALLYKVSNWNQTLDGTNIDSSADIVVRDNITSGETVPEYRQFVLDLAKYDYPYELDQRYKFTIILSPSYKGSSYSGAPDSRLIVDDIYVISEITEQTVN